MARKRTDFIVIHCSATPEEMDIGWKEIDRWHRAKGWRMGGYHHVIRRDGSIEKGRDLTAQGAHAKGYNHKSVGICLVGGVEPDGKTPEDNFRAPQINQLVALLKRLRGMYPSARIIGHNEISSKACPSFSVQERLKEWNLEQPKEDDLVDDEATNIAKALNERGWLTTKASLRSVSWLIRSGWHVTSKT